MTTKNATRIEKAYNLKATGGRVTFRDLQDMTDLTETEIRAALAELNLTVSGRPY